MNRIFKILLTISILSFAGGANQYISAQTNSGNSVQTSVQAMADDPALIQGLVGICARTVGGKEIVSVNAGKMLIPASNMKLITTGAAMHGLGTDYRFTTSVAYDGTITDGTLHGNLWIVGGGDPTLGSKDSIASPLNNVFRQWGKMVREAGIKRIDGYIIGDGRYFEGAMEEATWLLEDIGTYYGAGTCGLSFYENMMSFSAAPGQNEGDMVDMKPYYPDTPWMDFRYSCTTGAAGTGDQLYMFTSEFAPVAEIRGTLASDKGRKQVDCSNKFPEYTCATYFMKYLESIGISCSKGAGDFKLQTGWMDECECGESQYGECGSHGLVTLGKTQSPELERISFETNHQSNNVYAETLLRTIGAELGGSSLYPQSISTMEDILGKGLGIDISKGIFIKDGSGLSRGNLVSPDYFCRFLAAMTHSPSFDKWLGGLPSPGGNGTLSYNMKSCPESVRRRIRMKSGSMNGVRCYSGYILPEGYGIGQGRTSDSCAQESGTEDIIVFSVMVNNCTSPNWKVRPLLDKIITTIAME